MNTAQTIEVPREQLRKLVLDALSSSTDEHRDVAEALLPSAGLERRTCWSIELALPPIGTYEPIHRPHTLVVDVDTGAPVQGGKIVKELPSELSTQFWEEHRRDYFSSIEDVTRLGDWLKASSVIY